MNTLRWLNGQKKKNFVGDGHDCKTKGCENKNVSVTAWWLTQNDWWFWRSERKQIQFWQQVNKMQALTKLTIHWTRSNILKAGTVSPSKFFPPQT